LLAHNWDSLGRPARTVLSFLPLIIGQALGVFAGLKRRTSSTWCEGAAVFWALSIGASIALISQTYHISGDFPKFLLTWSLSGLPIVYLLKSSSVAVLYWVGVTAWLGSATSYDDDNFRVLLYWPLMALAVPYLIRARLENPSQLRVQWMLATLSICGIFGVQQGLAPQENFWVVGFSGYFATLYLAACLWANESNKTW
jgi:uncharacterized membrane protein